MNSLSLPAADLAMHVYPCLHDIARHRQLVLIHGWGWDSDCWAPLLPELQQLGQVWMLDLPGFGQTQTQPHLGLDALLAQLAAQLPDRALLMGWSLGGMLATALAHRYPHRVERLITLATNARFVAGKDYPTAMAVEINQQFNQAFAVDPAATLKRFTGLMAQGDAEERSLLKQLRNARASLEPKSEWQRSLEWLASLDNRTAFAELKLPGLHLLGEADALVPAAAAATLRDLNPGQQVEVMSGAAHAIHWSQPQPLVARIARFLADTEARPALDKRRVAQSFSRAATSYDSVAELQRAVGHQLLQQLAREGLPAAVTSASARILDLGCGTGYFTAQLNERFAQAEIIGLDIAEGMLGVARQRCPQVQQWVCGDAEQLPLQSASVDLVFSSLAIQWCEQLPRLFAELQRVLKPGGLLAFSTLGPDTLRELRAAWQSVDTYVHVNRFTPAEQLHSGLVASGMELLHWQEELRQLGYGRLQELTRELKALGAHNSNAGQPRGLTGRHKLAQFKQAYEAFRQDGLLPASYQVYYGLAQVPADH